MSIEDGVIASYQLEILVDHNQIFLEDCKFEGSDDLTQMYDEDATTRNLGVAPGLLAIFTARWYGKVRLKILLRNDQPDDDFTGWDHVAEASLALPSGCLVADGPESVFPFTPAGPQITVTPGVYRVRIYAGAIETVDEYMQAGEDHYRAVLWLAPYQAPALLFTRDVYPW